jgi:hypothetical protein
LTANFFHNSRIVAPQSASNFTQRVNNSPVIRIYSYGMSFDQDIVLAYFWYWAINDLGVLGPQ